MFVHILKAKLARRTFYINVALKCTFCHNVALSPVPTVGTRSAFKGFDPLAEKKNLKYKRKMKITKKNMKIPCL